MCQRSARSQESILGCLCVQDPFGNYVVQYVLELGHPEATERIMEKLMGHYSDLAQQKFSSNVVEKCLKLGGPSLAEARERVIRELVASPVMPRLLQVGPCAPSSRSLCSPDSQAASIKDLDCHKTVALFAIESAQS